MTEENRVSFSSNGAGVTLQTKLSSIHFSTEEYAYYESLFKIADTHNDGALSISSSNVVSLLLRTEIPWKEISQAIKLVADSLPSSSSTPPSTSPSLASFSLLRNGLPGGNPNFTDGHRSRSSSLTQGFGQLKFHHWLLLCKLLACHKQHRRDSLSACLALLDRTDSELRFRLSRNIYKFPDGECFKEFDVRVSGWKSYGDDYQSQHVKYQLTTVGTLVNRTGIPINNNPFVALSASSTESASSVSLSERSVVERRYSEFETLVQVLLKTCPGRVVPPLPVKDSRYLTPLEITAARRQHELQLFLNDISRHPQLKYSFALGVFLEASSNGLRAFFDLAAHMHDGRLEYSKSRDEQEGVAKMWSDGISLLSNGVSVLSARAKNIDFVSGIWGAVSKSVATITSPFSAQPEPALEEKARFFDSVDRTSKALEQVMQGEHGNIAERSRLSEIFKTMGDLVWTPELAKVLLVVQDCLEAATRIEQQAHDTQSVQVGLPLNYLGRFNESFRTVVQQRMQAQEARISADRQEQDARRVVEQLTTLQEMRDPEKSSEKLNAAKLRLAELEHSHDKRKTEEKRIVKSIDEEHQRLHLSLRTSVVSHLRQMAELRLAEARNARQLWEKCRTALQSS